MVAFLWVVADLWHYSTWWHLCCGGILCDESLRTEAYLWGDAHLWHFSTVAASFAMYVFLGGIYLGVMLTCGILVWGGMCLRRYLLEA